MLLLDGQGELLDLDSLLVGAISGARKLGLHRLGKAKLDLSASLPSMTSRKSSPEIPQYMRTEIGIRVW